MGVHEVTNTPTDRVRCTRCGGYGDIVDERPVGAGYSGAVSNGMYFRACPHCNGTGDEPTLPPQEETS